MRSLAALIAAAGLAQAQPRCTVQSCPRVECLHVAGEPAKYRFRVDGREIGVLDESTGRFTVADGSSWTFSLPATTPLLEQTMPPGGIEPGHLDPSGAETFVLDGQRVDKRAAYQSLQAGDLVDDSKHLRLTVIGGKAEGKRILDDLKADALQPLLAGVIVRHYLPSDWAVAEAGFKLDGKPTIYIQAPSGQVLHRQDDYEGGADRLAGAIRRARPDYDPKKDPDLTKPAPAPAPPPAPGPAPIPAPPAAPSTPWSLIAAIAAVLIYWIGLRTKSTPSATPNPPLQVQRLA